MFRWLSLIAIFALLVLSAQAEKRAFIVGVGDYAELTDLQKTTGDANGYASVFEQDLGFQVTRLIDPSMETFLIAFDAFTRSIAPGDEVTFIFSGHGWSDGGDNFLALSDAPRESSEFVLKRQTLSLSNDILGELKARKPGLLFTIIDACRDNPFDLGTRSVTRGLVRQEMVQGTLVVYAAGAREQALDRLGPDDPSPYSVFTRSLLPKLKDPARPLMRSVDEARNEVAVLASQIDHKQRPAIYSDISLDFCFAGACATAAPQLDQETLDWIELSSIGYSALDPCTKYARHLAQYPGGKFSAVAQSALDNPPCTDAAPSEPAPVPTPETTEARADVMRALRDQVNWRAVELENLLVLDTSKGRVLIEMFPEFAPEHVAQMQQIVRAGDLDGNAFHRVVQDFMAQAGDLGPSNSYPGIPAEFTLQTTQADFDLDIVPSVVDSDPFKAAFQRAAQGFYKGLPVAADTWKLTPSGDHLSKARTLWPMHCRGAVAAGRSQDPNSATTQFYIMYKYGQFLEQQYSVWGRVISGMDTASSFAVGEPPSQPDMIVRAQLAADMPEAERPLVAVLRTDGPRFQDALQLASDEDACAIEVPVRVAG